MDAKRLIALIEASDHEARSYSGRAMYGARCVATVLPRGEVLALGAALAVAAVDHVDGDILDPDDLIAEASEQVGKVRELMAGAREDQMGRDDAVVYWPDVEWPEDLCGHCGGEKPDGQSCGCFDNGGE